jgi:hypothetical protein
MARAGACIKACARSGRDVFRSLGGGASHNSWSLEQLLAPVCASN